MYLSTDFPEAASSNVQPLCRHYLAVLVQPLTLRVKHQTATFSLRACWGTGVFSDGQLEVLGIWSATGSDSTISNVANADLACRGVESVRVFVIPQYLRPWQTLPGSKLVDPDPLSAPEKEPGLSADRRVARLREPRASALTPRQWAMVVQGEAGSDSLHARLLQAVLRQGCFESSASARSFALLTLLAFDGKRRSRDAAGSARGTRWLSPVKRTACDA